METRQSPRRKRSEALAEKVETGALLYPEVRIILSAVTPDKLYAFVKIVAEGKPVNAVFAASRLDYKLTVFFRPHIIVGALPYKHIDKGVLAGKLARLLRVFPENIYISYFCLFEFKHNYFPFFIKAGLSPCFNYSL